MKWHIVLSSTHHTRGYSASLERKQGHWLMEIHRLGRLVHTENVSEPAGVNGEPSIGVAAAVDQAVENLIMNEKPPRLDTLIKNLRRAERDG